jgi:hypothetical protein
MNRSILSLESLRFGDQGSLVCPQEVLDDIDAFQFHGNTLLLQVVETLVMCEVLTHFNNLNVKRIQLPELAFGEGGGGNTIFGFHVRYKVQTIRLIKGSIKSSLQNGGEEAVSGK